MNAEDFLQPIPGATPSGKNLRYGSVYYKIKEARTEDDPTLPMGDWRRSLKVADLSLVIRLATEALKRESKDLWLAVWLLEAEFRLQGFTSLSNDILMLKGLIERFWDSLYPELENGDSELRSVPLKWLSRRLTQEIRKQLLAYDTGPKRFDLDAYVSSRFLASLEANGSEGARHTYQEAIRDGAITANEFDAACNGTPADYYVGLEKDIRATFDAFDQLTRTCSDKFQDRSSFFEPVVQALSEFSRVVQTILERKSRVAPNSKALTEAERAVIEQAMAAELPKPAVGQTANYPSQSTETALQPVEPASQADAINRLLSAAAYLRREDPFSAVPYVVLRVLRWGELRAAGHPLDVSLLAAPPGSERLELKRLATECEWLELLHAAEGAVAKEYGRGWLDPHRYAVKACENLGAAYSQIAQGIKSELRSFLNEFPEILKVSLADDTPIANAETLSWIRESILHDASRSLAAVAEREAEGQLGNDLNAGVNQTIDGIDEQPDQRIRALTADIWSVRSGRQRFQKKVQLAEYCLRYGYVAMAKSILDELTQEIDRLNLDLWELPEDLARVFAMLYLCLENTSADPALKSSLYARICRLDPSQAPPL